MSNQGGASPPTQLREKLERATIAANDYMIQLAEAEAEIATLKAEVDSLKADRADLHRTVARIWAALGITTYEQAGGKDISEIVATLKARVAELDHENTASMQEIATLRQELDAALASPAPAWAPGWSADDAAAMQASRNSTSAALQAGAVVPAEDQAEHFIQAAIDSAPEPLRRLGEYLTRVLDEDEWATAEPMLLALGEYRLARNDEPACPICGNEVRGQGGYLQCECPMPPASRPAEAGEDDETVTVTLKWLDERDKTIAEAARDGALRRAGKT